jgi:glycerol-3-phosphate dehydrogenase
LIDQLPARGAQLDRLRRETFDVAVIGGGINGAAVARDAAMRGLRVALIDRGDFAGQTSSRSTKLIHGGLRYLPQGQLRLVYEALRERERLSRLTAPHLVRPHCFLFPLYQGQTVSPFMLSAGLFIYDLLARTPPGHRHRRLSAAQVTAIEPQLTIAGLNGGALYYDGRGDDARLTLENAVDSSLHGAAVANYVALEGFDKDAGKLTAALVRDVLGADCFALSARIFVNAAGPWLDDVRRMAEPGAHPTIRLTKGVHLVLAAASPALRNSLVLSDGQGRIVFLIRDGGSILLGTTDTDFNGKSDQVRASGEDVDYLLQVVARTLPDAGIGRGAILTTFAGLRALVAGDGTRAPSSVSREELIISGASGMVSIAGGKLTTHRRIAERVVDLICRELGRPVRASPTLSTPLPGARPIPAATFDATLIPAPARTGLAKRYGSRLGMIDALIAQDQHLAQPLCAGCPVLAAEAVHAARSEMAQKLDDFMLRRTPMARCYPAQAAGAARRAARLMGAELGWSAEREELELAEFEAVLKASRTI